MRELVHMEPYPYAGHVVPLRNEPKEDGAPTSPAQALVEDWADRVYGRSWRLERRFATSVYRLRAPQLGLPVNDDSVLVVRILGMKLLIHTTEIDWSQM